MITTIDTTLTSIDKIYHIADVHIRNMKRHTEYRHVFKRLYAYIKKTKTKNSLIYVAGDIVHAKTDMSPELIDLVSEFFSELSKIAPTIVIAGNHDCNLNNSSRMDALYPIIKAMREPNLFYLKETGIYKIADINFNVMAVFDKPSDYIPASAIEPGYKIALHHGAVHNAVTDLGASLTNLHVTNDIFTGHDLVLLGDIHKFQYLNEEKTIAYPGSLVQQNHGEGLQHGILVWNVHDKSSEFVQITNDYGYYTLEIDNGQILNWTDDIPAKPRLRLRASNTDSAELKLLMADIRQKRKIEELTIQKVASYTNTNTNGKIVFANVRDVEFQNDLIVDYLNANHIIPDDILDSVRHINRTTNSKLIDTAIARNVIWIPKRFEFSNMFSYGEDNYVNFENMTGTNGIFAANASGKSTLLDAISFCCFDTCSRTNKAIHVLNNKKTRFTSKFEFELEGNQYVIERNGTKDKKGHVRVDVNFYTYDSNGDIVSLNADQRDNTNKVIRQYIGEYDDFILTALSLQNNNSGFIDKSQKDRKDLLASFLDINIFDQLFKIANEESKEASTLIKEYKRYDYSTIIADTATDISKTELRLQRLNKEKEEHVELITSLTDLIESKTAELIPVDSTLEMPEVIERQIQNINDELTQIRTSIQVQTNKISELTNDVKQLEQKSSVVNIDELKAASLSINAMKDRLQAHKVSHNECVTKLAYATNMVDKLASHKYNPECEYCISNPFVQDAEQAKNTIPSLQQTLAMLASEIAELEHAISIDTTERKLDMLDKLNESIRYKRNECDKHTSNLHLLEHKESNMLDKLVMLRDRYDRSNAQIEAIRTNKEIYDSVEELRDERNTIYTELKHVDNYIINTSSHMSVLRKQYADATQSIQKLRELELRNQAYEFYLDAIKRDGVPYLLIERSIPQIEQEINNILSQLVDFNIMLDTDGKNINAFIVYDDDNYWPIELTSGMERFISSLAIRTSLINVSSLPRPSFLAIDEGLGNLDSSMLSSISMLFDYLKTQFQFTMLISHIDQARDMVDNIIELSKINGYSKVQYSLI